jgi:hydrogenase maturation protease
MNGRALIIGYGNPYRQDDGVALHVLNRLREQLELPPMTPDDDGLDALGHSVDTIMLHQLLPELVPVLSDYQKVVLVDAHTGSISEEVRVVRVQSEYGFQAVTHHLSPGMLLALLKKSTGAVPECWLVSIQGDDFGFGEKLSENCARRVPTAVEKILSLI